VREGSVIKVHYLIQLTTRKWLNSTEQLDKWKNAVLELVAKMFPEAKFENQDLCGDLAPHVKRVLEYDFPSLSQLQRAILLNKVAEYDLGQFPLRDGIEEEF
jgi:hypothetical protein